jgi:hypothetical protein
LAVSRRALFVCRCKQVSGYYFPRGLEMFALRGMSELFGALAEREAKLDNWAMSLMYVTRPALMISQWLKQGNVAWSPLELLKTACLSVKYASSTGALTASDPRDLVFALLDWHMMPQTSTYSQTSQSDTKPYSQKSHEPSSYRAVSRSCRFVNSQSSRPSFPPGT